MLPQPPTAQEPGGRKIAPLFRDAGAPHAITWLPRLGSGRSDETPHRQLLGGKGGLGEAPSSCHRLPPNPTRRLPKAIARQDRDFLKTPDLFSVLCALSIRR